MSAWNHNDGNTRRLRTVFGKRQRKEIVEKIMRDMNDKKKCNNHTEQKLEDGECCQTNKEKK